MDRMSATATAFPLGSIAYTPVTHFSFCGDDRKQQPVELISMTSEPSGIFRLGDGGTCRIAFTDVAQVSHPVLRGLCARDLWKLRRHVAKVLEDRRYGVAVPADGVYTDTQ
jgi:hypothetical protein